VKIGLNTDSLGGLSLDAALDAAQRLGIASVEFPTGAWSSAPHVDLDRLLESEAARDELLGRVRDRGLSISALTCNGNQLDPVGGPAHDEVTRKTIALAPLLGVDRVVLMSGLPGGPGDRFANWIVVAWPPEAQAVLEHQWRVVTEYWQGLVRHAEEHGGVRLCIEMHGQQLVYNVPSLLRLREAAGPLVGANYDPSHLMWMGADPLAAARALDGAVYYVHAKDTRTDPVIAGINGVIDTTPGSDYRSRSWNYITLGYGHDEAWWRRFVATLAEIGYDGVLSIEHEDPAMSAVEGVEKSVALLRRVLGTRHERATAVAQD